MKKILCFISVVPLLAGCFTLDTEEEFSLDDYTKAEFASDHLLTTEEKLNNVQMALAKRLVYIGMKELDLLTICGQPHDINTSVGSWGVHKQFVYGYGSYERIYIYLENGLVTSWQS